MKKYKKIIALFLVLVLSFSTVSTPVVATYDAKSVNTSKSVSDILDKGKEDVSTFIQFIEKIIEFFKRLFSTFSGLDENKGVFLDVSNFEESTENEETKYSIYETIDSFKGTVNKYDEAKSITFEVEDLNSVIVSSGTIAVNSQWESDDIGFIVGTNKLTLTVTYDDGEIVSKEYIIDSYVEKLMNKTVIDLLDIDNDGLENYFEDYIGTDKNTTDTDGDKLTDYQEAVLLLTDPLKKDTDDNSVNDYDEDADLDTLSNGDELNIYGTDPMAEDTDDDLLNDAQEENYLTDPNDEDTDDDGVLDGEEVRIGSNPLSKETKFIETQTVKQEALVDTKIEVSAKVKANREQVGTLRINELSVTDDALINPTIPGYLSSGYNFTIDGEFDEAEIIFSFDDEFGKIGEDFQPRIYYYNEELNILEELPNQTVTQGKVSATVEHFSTYILLNKIEFDEVWDAEIKPTDYVGEIQKEGLDIIFVIDSSGSMSWNDSSNLRLSCAQNFVDKLGENDRAAVVDFDSYSYVLQGFSNDKDSIKNTISKIDDNGGTSLSVGMSAAINLFEASDRDNVYKYIIFLTDGDGTYSTAYTSTCADKEISVYTIGLGNDVKDATLQAIADGTEGRYYKATTSLDLGEIYEFVADETIDYSTDSNNDGISDYYTQLIYDGVLRLGNGSAEFCGTDLNYNKNGEVSNDYDGDGLLNGEELKIRNLSGGRVGVSMISDPTLKDTDFDSYNDKYEVINDLNPLKLDVDSYQVTKLTNNNDYSCMLFGEKQNCFIGSLSRGIWRTFTFDWFRTGDALPVLAEAFSEICTAQNVDLYEQKTTKDNGINIFAMLIQVLSEVLNLNDTAMAANDIVSVMGAVKDSYSSYKNLNNVNALNTALNTGLNKALARLDKGTLNKLVGKLDKLGDFTNVASFVLDAGVDISDMSCAFSKISANKDALLANLDLLYKFKSTANEQFASMHMATACDDIINSLNSEVDRYLEQTNNIAISVGEDAIKFVTSVIGGTNPLVLTATLVTGVLDALWDISGKMDGSYKAIAYERIGETLRRLAVEACELKPSSFYEAKNSDIEFVTAFYNLAIFRYYGENFILELFPDQYANLRDILNQVYLSKIFWFNK